MIMVMMMLMVMWKKNLRKLKDPPSLAESALKFTLKSDLESKSDSKSALIWNPPSSNWSRISDDKVGFPFGNIYMGGFCM
jgi:hypothetical protein